jgi:hypothetical protein
VAGYEVHISYRNAYPRLERRGEIVITGGGGEVSKGCGSGLVRGCESPRRKYACLTFDNEDTSAHGS